MILATLNGPNYSTATTTAAADIEVFDSIGDVIDALVNRYVSNGRRGCDVRTLDGNSVVTYFPAFEHGHHFTCYRFDGDLKDPAQVSAALIVVQCGSWDYGAVIDRDADDDTCIRIEVAGLR